MPEQLTDAGILTDADVSAFVMLCESFDNVKRCDVELSKTGEFYDSGKGQILRHPQAVQRDKYVAERSALMRHDSTGKRNDPDTTGKTDRRNIDSTTIAKQLTASTYPMTFLAPGYPHPFRNANADNYVLLIKRVAAGSLT